MDPEPTTVLVTAIGGGGHGEQILKALLLAQPGKYRVIGADADPWCPQFDLVDEPIRLPYATEASYMEALLRVCSSFGVRALLVGCEPELSVASLHRGILAKAGVFLPINPASVISTCMDKAATSAFLKAQGFEPPRYIVTDDPARLMEIDWLPVVVKPVCGGGGSRDCFVAQTTRELELLIEYLGMTGAAFLTQEYVGTPDDEYTVGVLTDMDGLFVNSIALRRVIRGPLTMRASVPNHSGRAELGERLVISSGVSQGVIGQFPDVTGPCEEIARTLGSRGPLNIQCRLVDGEIKVFEINPRFSGTTSLRAIVGFNEPDLLLRRHLDGEQIKPRFPYREGTILRSLTESVTGGRSARDWRTL